MGYIFSGEKITLSLLFALIYSYSFAQVQTYTEEQKINHLIAYVQQLHNATFIRNDEEHTAAKAAEHLKLKKNKAGNQLKTALDFIEKIASKSSITGKPYFIRMPNGKTYTCETVLKLELKKLVEGKSELLLP